MSEENPPLEASAVEHRLMEFIQRELLSPDVKLCREDDLLSGELLDSIAVLRLATFVAEEYELALQPADFVVENFQNVAVLTAYVQRTVAQAG